MNLSSTLRYLSNARRFPSQSAPSVFWTSLAIVVAALVMTRPAHAVNTGIDVKIGTLGPGIEIAHAFNENVGVRIAFNTWNYSKTRTEDGVDYDAKLKLRSFQVLGEWYPFSGVFRFDLGLVSNGNKFDLVAKPSAGGTFTFNNRTYNASDVDSANGHVDFKKVAPYLGVGWGRPFGSGFTMTADVGVLFQGKPRSSLTVVCGSTVPNCAQLTSDVAAEQADLDESLKDFRFYPVLSIGVGYRF